MSIVEVPCFKKWFLVRLQLSVCVTCKKTCSGFIIQWCGTFWFLVWFVFNFRLGALQKTGEKRKWKVIVCRSLCRKKKKTLLLDTKGTFLSVFWGPATLTKKGECECYFRVRKTFMFPLFSLLPGSCVKFKVSSEHGKILPVFCPRSTVSSEHGNTKTWKWLLFLRVLRKKKNVLCLHWKVSSEHGTTSTCNTPPPLVKIRNLLSRGQL